MNLLSFAGRIGLCLLSSVLPVVALSGILIDNSNNALAGADVYLVNKNMHATTDAAGKFSFETNPVKQPLQKTVFSKPVLSGNRIYFSLARSGKIEYRIYTLKGADIFHYVSGNMSAGNHFITLSQSDVSLARGTYIVRFRSGGETVNFRFGNISPVNRSNSISADWLSSEITTGNEYGSLRKSAQDNIPVTIDTLIITKITGDVTSTRKIRVYDYNDSINSTLYTTNGIQMLILDPSNDNDADGLTNYEERYVYFTNSELADTDGDGKNDYTELQDKLDPLVADIPSITFRADSYPVITATLSYSNGGSTDFQISKGGDYSSSSAFTSEQQVNGSVSVAAMVGVEVALPGSVTLSSQLTTTVGAGWSQTWSSDQSTSMSSNWSEAQTISKSSDMTISGGKISVEITLINNSGQDLTLVNPIVRLTSRSFQSGTLSTQIGELTLPTDDKNVYISSKTGANTATRLFSVTIDNPDIIKSVSTLSSGLVAQLTNIQFQTSNGGIDTLMTNVYRRTSEVVVDYGTALSNTVTKKRIATNCHYNEFYTSYTDRYLSSTLEQVLKTSGASPVCDSVDGNYGITSIGTVNSVAMPNGRWTIAMQHRGDSSVRVFSTKLAKYDPSKINTDSVDIIICAFDGDYDNDGMPSRVEAMLGCNDSLADSDGDGISDRNEYMGWRRDADAAGVKWQTNPASMDTDRDGIGDYEDPDPLTSYNNPADSTVDFREISLVSLQGSPWTDTTCRGETVSAVASGAVVKGPGAVKIKFSHPVYSILVQSRANNKTDTITNPDSINCYSAAIDIPPGDDTLDITVVSRNGCRTRKITLTEIHRQLASIDVSSQDYFYVKSPSLDKFGIAMDYYVNYEKTLALDPYITDICVMRTDIYAVPLVSTDKTAKLTADNLGCNGDGVVVSALSTIQGKDGSKNIYSVRNITKTSSTYRDETLLHKYDYAYFPYTACNYSGKQFYSAPVGGKGCYAANNRDLIIDSVRIVMSALQNCPSELPLVEYPWWHAVQGVVSIASMRDSNRITAKSGVGIHSAYGQTKGVIVNCHSTELKENGVIGFGPYTENGTAEANFRRDYYDDWQDVDYLPESITTQQITAPDKVSGPGGYEYKSYSVTDFSETLWMKAVTYFQYGFNVFWKYKYNSLSD